MEEKSYNSKKSEIAEVAKELIGWEDNKLFNTLKDLTLGPGEMVRNYCNGEQDKYLSPITYFLGVTGLVAYLSSVSGLNDFAIKEGLKNFDAVSLDWANKDVIIWKEKIGVINSFLLNETAQKLMLVPLLLLLTWIFYKKVRPSFKENSWFSLFVQAHNSLISLPFMGIWCVTKELGYFITFGTAFSYLFWIWASKGFYNIKWSKAILKATLLYVSYYLIFMMFYFLIFRAIIM